MNPSADPLSVFDPLVQTWFRQRFENATEIQQRSWPSIAASKNVLLTAPTGSGKTLTAFLWALNQLLVGAWPGGSVRVLYISPLKALNYDIERNLAGPLRELQAVFEKAGRPAPEVRVLTRSGDTPSRDRQRMLRRPPEILITTPESLNILLTSRGGRRLLGELQTVILDEIHAVAAGKRGAHLMSAVDRLVPLSGEFQRIAISATIRPLERIAEMVGGYIAEHSGESVHYRRRPMEIFRARGRKKYRIKVAAIPAPAEPAVPGDDRDVSASPADTLWSAFADRFRRIIRANRSTLLFANSRRTTEKVTRLINEGLPRELAYSHHGSLSREIRSVVEERLKKGELAAIVATNSLELGIDIGNLDEVVLIQTPPTVSSAVQRIGRSGHGVGETSRSQIFPTHGRDILDAAVVAKCVLDEDIEEVQPVECPLDVLAQVVVSMVAAEPWPIEELYEFLRTSYPFRQLKRRQLDLVLEMLAGRYADSRVRELRPRISIDRVEGILRPRDGIARLIYSSGGTIPDRGYYALRLEGTKAKLGELDEEFVWERSVSDTFTLGAQSWRIQRITHNDVLVTPARSSANLAPFWKGDERDRDFHLSSKLGAFLRWSDPRLDDPALKEELQRSHCLEKAAAEELMSFLRLQREVTGCPLPHDRHLVVEHYSDPFGGGRRPQILIHTLWGGRVNRPLSIALAQAIEETVGGSAEVLHNNDSINIVLPEEGMPGVDFLSLVDGGNLEKWLRRRLESTGFFGARFRQNAARALLLPRTSFKRRMPLWLNRLRSKKLLQAVSRYEDFPLLAETWRTCLKDDFDLENLFRRLAALQAGELRVSEVHTTVPSPFAADLIFKQTNRYMYEDDTPQSGRESKLRGDLLRELVFSSQLRPRLPSKLVRTLEGKLQRLAPGYAPRPGLDLEEWVRERLLLSPSEWGGLLSAVARDHSVEESEAMASVAAKLLWVSLPRGREVVTHVEEVLRLRAAFGGSGETLDPRPLDASKDQVLADLRGWLEESPQEGAGNFSKTTAEEPSTAFDPLAEALAQWLSFYGPLPRRRLGEVLGLGDEALDRTLAALSEDRRIVVDELTEGSAAGELEICDSENLERLLRMARAEARPNFEALPLPQLPLFLAAHQGLGSAGTGVEGLQANLERLLLLPLPAEAWEAEILPARLAPYYPAWLDEVLRASELRWMGSGRQKLTFYFPSDPVDWKAPDATSELSPDRVFPDDRGRYSFEDLVEEAGVGAQKLNEELWRWVWEGRVSSDSFQVLRQGLASKFSRVRWPTSAGGGARGVRRNRWQSPKKLAGRWYRRSEGGNGELDALELEELNKARARLLLDRYGVLFRELTSRELPAFQWRSVFRALRLMELSGEVLSGQFFEGLSGLQFATHEAFRQLRKGVPADRIFWLSARDPASVCGLGLEGLSEGLPARRSGNFLVYHGQRLVVVAQAKGRHLEIRVPPDHPELATYFEFLRVLVSREAQPLKYVEIRQVNGESVFDSPYYDALHHLASGTREARGLRIRKRY